MRLKKLAKQLYQVEIMEDSASIRMTLGTAVVVTDHELRYKLRDK